MSNDNNQRNFKDTIVIDKSVSDNLNGVVTINVSNSKNKCLENNDSYKISPDGKIIFNNRISNLDNLSNSSSLKESYLKNKRSKELLINELTKYGFEEIPIDLNEIQLESILEFSADKIVRNIDHGQIYPFSVEKDENDDLIIILLIYNGSTLPFALGSLPFKLKDAKSKVIFADSINLNKIVSPKKTGIYYLKVNKETLKEDNMDLSTWSITFEV